MRRTEPKRARGALLWGMTIVLIVLASLVAGEVLARIVFGGPQKYGSFPSFPYQYDSAIGLRHMPNLEVVNRSKELNVVYQTHSEGFRSRMAPNFVYDSDGAIVELTSFGSPGANSQRPSGGKSFLGRLGYYLNDHSQLYRFAARSVDFVDLTEAIVGAYDRGNAPHFKVDGHLNEHGHRVVADVLEAYIESSIEQ